MDRIVRNYAPISATHILDAAVTSRLTLPCPPHKRFRASPEQFIVERVHFGVTPRLVIAGFTMRARRDRTRSSGARSTSTLCVRASPLSTERLPIASIHIPAHASTRCIGDRTRIRRLPVWRGCNVRLGRAYDRSRTRTIGAAGKRCDPAFRSASGGDASRGNRIVPAQPSDAMRDLRWRRFANRSGVRICI